MRGNLSDTVDPTEKYGEVVFLILLHGVLLLRLRSRLALPLIKINYMYD